MSEPWPEPAAVESEYRVPVACLPARVVLASGGELHGRVFLPDEAPGRAGSGRPERWINGPERFFPFLPDGARNAMILGKHAVVLVQLDDPVGETGSCPRRRVRLACGDRDVEGDLEIDLPAGRRRVVDALNQDEEFLTLRDGPWLLLVQKRRVASVTELGEEAP